MLSDSGAVEGAARRRDREWHVPVLDEESKNETLRAISYNSSPQSLSSTFTTVLDHDAVYSNLHQSAAHSSEIEKSRVSHAATTRASRCMHATSARRGMRLGCASTSEDCASTCDAGPG